MLRFEPGITVFQRPHQTANSSNMDIYGMKNHDRKIFTSKAPCDGTREVNDIPHGFKLEDIQWAGLRNHADSGLEEYLSRGSVVNYQMGIAIDTGRLHASVIVREGQDLLEPLTRMEKHTVPMGAKRLHIHNSDDMRFLDFTFDELRRDMKECRYFHLDAVPMTENRLKHLALTSCPREHRTVTQDCATFAQKFLCAVLDYKYREGNQEMLEEAKARLNDNIHILDGSSGQSEAASRNDPVLGDGGHSSVTAVEMLLSLINWTKQIKW
ncbi:hypothetical protein GGR52DRAFT_543180 [Hypoxylon sp. FL1284]|nr:hypothetical protein GGR52DRAFT_543180 [Hypoxylon sp. FL1284]